MYQNWRYRWLTFGTKAIQTLINRKDPSSLQLEYLHVFLLLPKRIRKSTCLLGLGGGAVVHAFQVFAANEHLDVVESLTEVIDVAQHYFNVHHSPIIEDDAMHFVEHCNKQYGYVLVDLAEGDHFPENCTNESFFSHCKRLLTQDGFFIMNVPYLSRDLRLLHLLQEVFGKNMLTIPIPRTANSVVIAKRTEAIGFLDEIQRHLPLKELYWREGFGMVGTIGK